MQRKEADLLRDAVLIADHERGYTVISHRNDIIKTLVDLVRTQNSILLDLQAGYSYDPGDSDLDNEQPIHIRAELGLYRKMSLVVWRTGVLCAK